MTAVVQWFGAHPTEGSVSMEVYRRNLWEARRESDPLAVRCWPQLGELPERAGLLSRAWGKYVDYPRRVARTGDADVVHFLDHSSSRLLPKVAPGTKCVVTLHDLIPLRFDGGLSRAQLGRFRRGVECMRDADAIVSVSEYSKAEAIELLGIPAGKVHVVPNGVGEPGEGDRRSRGVAALRDRGVEVVVLSVGSVLERKNLGLLPGALGKCAALTGRRIGLLRIGAPLDGALAGRINAVVGDGGLMEAGRLGEADLWAAYREVDVLIVPSLYEGFGLPVLEGLRCGTAVACSDRTSLPEVGGTEVEYFDPASEDDAGAALARAVGEAGDREQRARRRARAAEFSWRRHLEGLYVVYNSLLEAHAG